MRHLSQTTGNGRTALAYGFALVLLARTASAETRLPIPDFPDAKHALEVMGRTLSNDRALTVSQADGTAGIIGLRSLSLPRYVNHPAIAAYGYVHRGTPAGEYNGTLGMAIGAVSAWNPECGRLDRSKAVVAQLRLRIGCLEMPRSDAQAEALFDQAFGPNVRGRRQFTRVMRAGTKAQIQSYYYRAEATSELPDGKTFPVVVMMGIVPHLNDIYAIYTIGTNRFACLVD